MVPFSDSNEIKVRSRKNICIDKKISSSVTFTDTEPAIMPSTVDSANGSNGLSARHMKLGFNMYLQDKKRKLILCTNAGTKRRVPSRQDQAILSAPEAYKWSKGATDGYCVALVPESRVRSADLTSLFGLLSV